MDTLFNFVMGFSAAVLPALTFIAYYLHKSNLEQTTHLERRLSETAMNLRSARNEVTIYKKKAQTSERNNIDLTKQKEELQTNLNGIGMRYLRDSLRALEEQLDSTNLELSKRKVEKLIAVARKYGVRVDEGAQAALISEMEESFNMLVKREELKAKRRQIKRLRREEKKFDELDERISGYEQSKEVIETAIEDTEKSETIRDHQAEIAWMRQQLEDVKLKLDRARQQPVKKFPGYVYVLSDKNSFGEGTYLVGATKRLEPMDILREIGHDTVPFNFNVHMVIHSKDAGGLEQRVCEELQEARSTRIDFHQGFFETNLDRITEIVAKVHAEMQSEQTMPANFAEKNRNRHEKDRYEQETRLVSTRFYNRAA